MTEQQNFVKLLKYSNELKKNKYSDEEDPEAFDTLLKFLVRIEDNFHDSEKHTYINLAKDFLADQITPDNFSYAFMAIYEGINEKLNDMKKDASLELANFLKPRRPELGNLLARIYGSCNSFSPDPEVDIAMADEKEL